MKTSMVAPGSSALPAETESVGPAESLGLPAPTAETFDGALAAVHGEAETSNRKQDDEVELQNPPAVPVEEKTCLEINAAVLLTFIGPVPPQLKNNLPPITELEPGAREQIAQNSPAAAICTHGMAGAQESVMCSTEQEIAQPAGKLPRLGETTETTRRALDMPELAAVPSSSFRVFEVRQPSRLLPIRELESLNQRVVSEIQPHIQVIRAAAQDRLEVVLRPDACTELHVELTRSEGLIHVHVRCEKGDVQALQAEWGNVQTALAVQGVRVDALESASGAASFSQHEQSSHSRPQEREVEPLFFLELEEPNKTTHPTRSLPGWQRWA
jgi:hypothetical protein